MDRSARRMWEEFSALIENSESVTGSATSIDKVIRSRRGNAPERLPMVGTAVRGTWTVDLANPDVSSLFHYGQVQDILFVITFGGQAPALPA
jgi:hypothetical protein